MHRTLGLLIAGLVIIAAVPLLLGGSGMFAQLAHFPLSLLAVMIGMIFVCWYLNAAKLRVLLAGRSGHLTRRESMGVIMAVEFAICATPGGAGGVLTLIALMKQRGMRPAQTTAVFAVDQMIDLLFFFASMLAMVVYIIVKAVDIPTGWLLGMPLLLMGCAFTALFTMGRYQGGVMRGVARLMKLIRLNASRRRQWLRKLMVFRNSLKETLQMPKRLLLLAFFFGVLHWIVRYSVLYLALYGLGKPIDWGFTYLAQMLSMAAGQLTLLPGGAGGAELSSMALLSPMVGQETASAAILIWRAVTYYFYLIAGFPAFLLLAGRPLFNRLMQMKKGDLDEDHKRP